MLNICSEKYGERKFFTPIPIDMYHRKKQKTESRADLVFSKECRVNESTNPTSTRPMQKTFPGATREFKGTDEKHWDEIGNQRVEKIPKEIVSRPERGKDPKNFEKQALLTATGQTLLSDPSSGLVESVKLRRHYRHRRISLRRASRRGGELQPLKTMPKGCQRLFQRGLKL